MSDYWMIIWHIILLMPHFAKCFYRILQAITLQDYNFLLSYLSTIITYLNFYLNCHVILYWIPPHTMDKALKIDNYSWIGELFQHLYMKTIFLSCDIETTLLLSWQEAYIFTVSPLYKNPAKKRWIINHQIFCLACDQNMVESN